MLFFKLKILCVISLVLVGCGGGGKNNPSVVLSDSALLECLSEDLNEDDLMNLIAFECSNIDLSEANISELKSLPKLEKIHLDNTNLNDLNDISSIEQITELKIINNFPKLELGGSKPLDISSITSLNKLNYLDLSYNYIPNLDAISSLEKLESLTLNKINIGFFVDSFSGNNFSIQNTIDLSPLSTLTKLTSLSMEDNFIFFGDGYVSAFAKEFEFAEFTDITALNNLSELIHLDLSSSIYGGINDTGFPYFPKLLSLDLSENHNGRGTNGSSYERGIINIRSLNKLTTLTHLDLHSNSIEELAPLASLTNLTSLDLSDNYYINDIWRPNNNEKPIFGSIRDIESLATLSQLSFLNLSRTNITNFSFLANLDNLSSLNIDNNYIRDEEVNSFPFITNLENLSIKNNWLTSSGFLSIYNFKKIDLSQNCISDFSQVQADELITDSQQAVSNCDVF